MTKKGNTEVNIEIEKNVPLVRPNRGCYPFGDMEINDSFVADRKAQASAAGFARRNGVKFVTRKIDAEKVRIWRVK